MEKYSYEEWKKQSEELNKNKQILEELSKLYIVCHEKVNHILRKCQTDLKYDPLPQTKLQLNFIKLLLDKLVDRQHDQYLSKIDPNILDKYEKHLHGLIWMLKETLRIWDNRNSIDPDKLVGISEDRDLKNEFNLRNQVKKSQQRLIRTKSGHRITRDRKQIDQKVNKQQYQGLFSQTDDGPRNQKAHFQKLHDKQNIIKKMMCEQVTKSKDGLSVNFKNKYTLLDSYLVERKQFADLFFCQEYFDQMIREGRTRKNEAKIIEKKDPDLNKLFPEFNIKTKYMKKNVKANILQVIFQVKKVLLKEYHEANTAKMAQAAEQGSIPIKYTPKKKTHSSMEKTHGFQQQLRQTQMRFKSTNRVWPSSSTNRKNKFRATMSSMKDLGTTPNVGDRAFWPTQQTDHIRNKFINRFQQSKFTEYSIKQPSLVKPPSPIKI